MHNFREKNKIIKPMDMNFKTSSLLKLVFSPLLKLTIRPWAFYASPPLGFEFPEVRFCYFHFCMTKRSA